MAKSGHFYVLLDIAMLRRRSLRLGEPEPRVYALSGPPRHRSASPRQTSSPRRTCKSCFSLFISLILTIIHLINEDPNK